MTDTFENKGGSDINENKFTIIGRDEDITSNERALGSYDDVFYSKYKNQTWDVLLREMWAIQRVLEGGYRIDDKRELKEKVRLLDLISDRVALEYKRQGLKIPLLPEQENPKPHPLAGIPIGMRGLELTPERVQQLLNRRITSSIPKPKK